MDLTDTIIPKSDQLNAEDLLSGPRTVTITEVRRGTTDQPVDVVLDEFGPGRPFKPSKTVRRILVAAWGPDASTYTGRRLTIYRDPTVRFGGQDVGGIRVSHLSHIDKPLSIALTVTRGKRAPYVVQPLADVPPPPATNAKRIADCIAHFRDSYGVTAAQLEARVASPSDDWSAADLSSLLALAGELKRGEKTLADEFPDFDSEGAGA